MSFPRYEEYKDSGVEWLGEIPSHWGFVKIGHHCRLNGGGTPDREKLEYWNGEIPWITPKDMKADILVDSEERITERGLQNSSASILKTNQVLLVMRSGILKHTLPVGINDVETAINQDIKALDVQKAWAPLYFMRFVQGYNKELLLEWGKQGATVESLETNLLLHTRIPLPPIEEQKLIVAYLEAEVREINSLIGQAQKLIDLLKEKRQAVISHAVTKGLDPTVPMKDSGIEWLGEVPEGWEVVKLKSFILKMESGKSVNSIDSPALNGEIGVLKTSCVYSGQFNRGENKIVVPSELHLVSCPVIENTLIVSRMNTPDLVGFAGLALKSEENLYLPDRLWQVHFKGVLPAFIHFWTMTQYYRNQVKVSCSGTSSSMQNLSQNDFRSFVLSVPSTEDQDKIVSHLNIELEKYNALIHQAQKSIALLQERRSALISAAVTGKIDVRGLVPQQEAVEA
ncbi:restriction endonuclease subunit S [Paenibacillus sp. FSL W8-1187]|uniref:Type I restriction-modification system, specificity subunit S n=1 Tax=Paenibacillus pasadenensis TaxID=217090 RepID=A0A2N5N0T9_9BACL|nr:restriction endonuclease subunit S [Paenibacillus pasadenensis]PLT43942.1 Type I restriction-modification system, specificity subunit S [Paenibacillus pasadenensis]